MQSMIEDVLAWTYRLAAKNVGVPLKYVNPFALA
jgi:hypothetical protein